MFAVNALLVQAATSTFGGLETGSSYKAGLMFAQEMALGRRQEALHWQRRRHDLPATERAAPCSSSARATLAARRSPG